MNVPTDRAQAMRTAWTLSRNGDSARAEAIYHQLLSIDPTDVDVLTAWARVRRGQGDDAAAAGLLDRALAIGADGTALLERAALHLDYQEVAPAQALLRRAPKAAVNSSTGQVLMGRAAEATRHFAAAEECYRAATRLDPKNVSARLALARTVLAQGHDGQALAAYSAVVKRWPDNVEAQMALGQLYGQMHRFRDALTCFDKAERLGLDVTWHLSEAAMGLAHVCDWSETRTSLRRRLDARLRRPQPCLMEPYVVLAQEDDPAALLRMGQRIAGAVAAHVAPLPRPAIQTERRGDKIRLGYVSADFNQHATSLLMAEVFALHDRSRFEVVAYSHSRDDGTPTRRRVVTAFDRFVELEMEPPSESARRIAADGIDILIDLKGYSTGARPEIPALRPAPVQVAYLGYQATTGAPWMDYVIADPTLVPFSEQPHWTERIVHLPGCYYPNDRLRPRPAPAARGEHGLPEGVVVFACFNQTYKITPEVFTIWMILLRAVPDSVLWLMGGNPPAQSSLKAHAGRDGIDPDRLIFAPPVTLDIHVARHACADLFLDTAPYGAHTTCSDALWAGLPVITMPGRSFASRVAATQLLAVGLPDLITASWDDYVGLARELAGDPHRRAALRSHLIAARDTAPLFDAARITRALDAAFDRMVALHRGGQSPQSFAVQERGGQFFHQPA